MFAPTWHSFPTTTRSTFSFWGTRWLPQAQLISICPNAIFNCIATGSSIGRRCEALPSFSFLLFWAAGHRHCRCRSWQCGGQALSARAAHWMAGACWPSGLLPRLGVVVAGRRRQRELGACAFEREQRNGHSIQVAGAPISLRWARLLKSRRTGGVRRRHRWHGAGRNVQGGEM